MSSPSPLVVRVRRFWRSLGDSPGAVVAAVSGGPDSVALVRGLLAASAGPVVMAHLNHQLRGADSEADEAFVCDLQKALTAGGAPVELCRTRIDVAARALEDRDNLENAARRLRYDWLLQVAREKQARWVATGHTADDQAETVLHRLLRGTGLRGLAGIPSRRPLGPGVEVVRPLLHVTRAEVLAFLQAEGQAFREDRTNRDLDRTRNRIRHELLPHLANYNPAIVSVLGRLAGQAEKLCRTVEEQARRLLGEAELPRAGRQLVFDRDCLAAAPRHLVREAFRLAWAREGWPMGAMGWDDWDRLAAVALGEAVAVDLPGGIRIQCRQRVVIVGEW